jgi:hypothetical protein
VDTASGIVDSTWDPLLKPNDYTPVRCLTIDGGLIYFGGMFTAVDSIARGNIAAVRISDGMLTDFNPYANGAVWTISTNGTLLFEGGEFSSGNGQRRLGLAAVDAMTGTVKPFDPSRDISPYTFIYGGVTEIALRDSSLYVCGTFGNLGTSERKSLGAVSTVTGDVLPFDAHFDWSTTVTHIVLGENALYAGGTNGYLRSFDLGTGAMSSWLPALSQHIQSLAIRDSVLYVGSGMVIAFNLNTGLQITSWTPVINGSVDGITVADNKVYLSGQIYAVNGKNQRGYAAVSAADGSTLPWKPIKDTTLGVTSSVVVIHNGKSYIGGSWDDIDGYYRSGMACTDTITGIVDEWDPGKFGTIPRTECMLAADSMIFVGGGFWLSDPLSIGRKYFAVFTDEPESHTPSPMSAFPYVQNFEGTTNEGWTYADSGIWSPDWMRGTPGKLQLNSPHSGVNAWVTSFTLTTIHPPDQYLISPVFDCTSLPQDLYLSFWHNFQTSSRLYVELSTDGGSLWHTVDDTTGSSPDYNSPLSTHWYNYSSGSTHGWRSTSTSYPGHVNGWIRSTTHLPGTAGVARLQIRWRMRDASYSDEGWAIDDVSLTTDPPTDVENERPELPLSYKLSQNYPNPFNPVTTINYSLPVGSKVRLTILNLLGQVVATLVDETEPAGFKYVKWDASGLASGIYFYRLDASSIANPGKSFTQVKKMILLK